MIILSIHHEDNHKYTLTVEDFKVLSNVGGNAN